MVPPVQTGNFSRHFYAGWMSGNSWKLPLFMIIWRYSRSETIAICFLRINTVRKRKKISLSTTKRLLLSENSSENRFARLPTHIMRIKRKIFSEKLFLPPKAWIVKKKPPFIFEARRRCSRIFLTWMRIPKRRLSLIILFIL